MIEKRILLQISNTIIANLNNADGIGFLYGKIGLALFMYRYSRFVNNQFYENIADEIIDDILILIVIIGFATFGIGCVIDSIFIWIAIFTGKIMISANTYILLMGVPAVGTPAIFLLSLLIIRVMKFFVK